MAFLPFLDNIDPGQGGSAMVIPEYPPWNLNLKPERYPCKHCDLVFETYDAWFQHRFHMHPVMRPMLVLGEVEVLTPRFTVMKALPAEEVRLVNVCTCQVNGRDVELQSFAKLVTTAHDGFYDIRLMGEDGQVESRYEISVEIATEEHIQWVEQDFGKLAAAGALSVHSINAFVQSTMRASSARRYMDGLANYLFGVLGKDQRGDTALSQEQGRAKLNEAHQTLQLVDRLLAKVVSAVIEFQSNAFSNTKGLQTVPRLQHAMRWFKAASRGVLDLPTSGHDINQSATARVPLDSATDELLTWVNTSGDQLTLQLKNIERRARQPDWLPEDRAKARVLAAVVHLARADRAAAVQTARSFRHDPVFQALADRLIAAGTFD